MRAFAVISYGQPPAVHELPIPAAEGAILIRIKCAGVNPIDYKLVDRLTATSTCPFVMGIDFAGVVERVLAGEREFHNGDRIFGMARTHGAYAEYSAVVLDTTGQPVGRIPDGVTDEQAAALPIPAITALGSLELLSLTAKQRIVVMGASGGVGGYAVQMAVARGAHVIATVRGDSDEARHLGAEEVYDTKAKDAIETIRAYHPEGVDAALDLVNGKDAIQRDAEILKPGGKLVSTTYAADEGWFAARKITAHNISSMTNALSTTKGLDQIARMLEDGIITARVRTIARLEEAGQVIEKLRNGGLSGKAVIRI